MYEYFNPTKRAIPHLARSSTMEQFRASTSLQEARHLTALTFQAIAAGWPIQYAKISAVQAANGTAPTATLDTDAMMAAAADLAAKLTQAVDERHPESGKEVPFDPGW
jgi:hypothetical protein